MTMVATRAAGSELARWADEHLPIGERVVDLGTGDGGDALFLARQGRPVLAYDVEPAALDRLRDRARRHELEVDVRRLDLGSLAGVLAEGAELARSPYHLYARRLVGCLDPAARSNLWLLARMALRGRGGRLVLEVDASYADLARRELGAAGGRVLDAWAGADPQVRRMVASW